MGYYLKAVLYLFSVIIFVIPAFAVQPVTHSPDGTATHNNINPESLPRLPYRHVPDEILVKFHESVSAPSQALIHSKARTKVKRKFKTIKGLELVKLPHGMSVHHAIKTFKKDPGVLYAEPNYIINAFATPNDTRYSELWGLNNTGQTGGTNDADIDAPEAWDLTTGSSNAVVAVIDTGIDYTHPDLAANMFHNTVDCNTNGIDDDGNGYIDDCYGIDTVNTDSDPMDDHSHGTHVAGTIGAAGNNASGVVGVNWTANILACKFLDSSSSGDTAGAIACLDYIAGMKDRGVNIIASNNSWGGGTFSQALYDAINTQRERGILFIAAAGNDYLDNETIQSYPCSYYLSNILCVASTNATDNLSSFSNYGKRIVHLGAPGEDILSTVPSSFGSYESFSGTSMATPHVTGVVGLIHAFYPGSDWRAVKNRILAGGDTQSSLTALIVTGRRLNVYGSLTCNNSTVLSRLRPIGSTLTAGPGAQIELSALHINCANPNGNVTVSISPSGETVTLLDDGLGSDQIAGDGIYTAVWAPSSGGTYTLSFPGGDNVTVNVDPDLQAGFPVKAWTDGGTYHGGQAIHTLVADIDGNPGLEIVATSLATGPLNAWSNTGIPLDGWPIETPGAAYPVAGELSLASGGNEIFVAAWGQPGLSAYASTGTLLPSWPRNSANYVATPASLADIDGDGLDEIFVEEEDWKLHAYKANGIVLAGWPVYGSSSQERHTSAIADLDGDGDVEIISASGGSSPVYLHAYHHTGTLVAGFPISFNGYTDTYPVGGDVDGDGQKEIIVIERFFNGTAWISRVLIYSVNGVLKRSILLSGGVGYGTAPALADLDGNGVFEIIVQTDTALNVVRGDGTNYSGWPQIWGSGSSLGNSSPVVGDVDGDGLPDIVVTVSGANSGVYVYDRNGALHPRFPKVLPLLGDSAVPAIANIDGDGRNEIIITGSYWDGYSGYYDKVWVYDLGGSAHGPVLWGQFMGNSKHTGTSNYYYTLNVMKAGTGNGTVTSNPAGINCGSDCLEVYTPGTIVTLSAIPDSGSTFTGWSGDADCSDGVVTMDADKICTANFAGTPNISSSPTSLNFGDVNTNTTSPSQTVTFTNTGTADLNVTDGALSGTDASMFAIIGGTCPNPPFTSAPSESCNLSYTFTPVSAGSKTATFTINSNDPDTPALAIPLGGNGIAVSQYTLTVEKTGTGSGTVTATGINCGSDCTEIYTSGTVVTLSPAPDTGSAFTGWTGCDSVTGNTCDITMNTDKTVTAEFIPSALYVVWADDTYGNNEIFIKKSTDGGTNWTTTRLTNNTGNSQNPVMSVDGSTVYIIWQDDTYGPAGVSEIFLKKSTDGGTNWTTTRLTDNTGNSVAAASAASGNDIYVVWQDDTYGNYETFLKKSTDGGANWTTTRLTNNAGNSQYPSIVVNNAIAYIVWQDDTYGNNEIFIKKSTDGGANWTTTRLTNNAGNSQFSVISRDAIDNSLYVVWQDDTYGNNETFLKKSTDGGANWTTTRLTNNAGSSQYPSIVVNNAIAYIVWQDDTYGPAGVSEIFLKKSTDSGTNWTTTRLTNNAGNSQLPIVMGSGSEVYIVWQDDTYGNNEIFIKKSTDGGTNWTTTRLTNNAGNSAMPVVPK